MGFQRDVILNSALIAAMLLGGLWQPTLKIGDICRLRRTIS